MQNWRMLVFPIVWGKDSVDNELGRVVDTLPGLVWTALPDEAADFLNQRWCEYTGLGVDQALGQEWQAAIYPDDVLALLDPWARPAHLSVAQRRRGLMRAAS